MNTKVSLPARVSSADSLYKTLLKPNTRFIRSQMKHIYNSDFTDYFKDRNVFMLHAADFRCLLLQNFDAVGWVFWPVKPSTESENRLQLGSLSTSVNIDRFTVVDNTLAVGNDSRPWVVPQLINGCQLSWGRDGSLWIQSLVEFLISSGHLSPHIGSAWWARHDNNNKMSE